MHSKAKRATKAERERMARLKEMPCLCCRIQLCPQPSPTEVHHLLSGNKRRGHLYSVPLCEWHHRGTDSSFSEKFVPAMTRNFGPSLARSSKAFHAAFGSDDELLARTNSLLEKHT